jgi:hypothetical protein
MKRPGHYLKLSRILIAFVLVFGLLVIPLPVKAGGGIQLIVDTTSDNPALKACTATPGDCSLRGAIQHVNEDTSGTPPMYEIVLSAATYTLSGAAGEDNNVTGDLDTKPWNWLYITGAGETATWINGNHLDRVFDHWGPEWLILTDLTIQNGQVATGMDGGGGIRNLNGGDLWLIRVTVDSNTVNGSNGSQDIGGGIHSAYSTLNLEYATISNNRAVAGGGLSLSNTSLWMDQTVVSGNLAAGSSGGGIDTGNGGGYTILRSSLLDNSASQGAGMYLNGLGSLSMIDTLVSGNTTTDYSGGGLMVFGSGTLLRVTLSGNLVPNGSFGGGLYVDGDLSLVNTTITDNTAYQGSGLYIDKSGSVSFMYVTDANNNLYTGGLGSAVYMHDGGTGTGGSFSFQNSIFSSYDPDVETCNRSAGATYTVNDYGNNLFDQTLNCYTHIFTDLTEAYPALGSLGYYGGWTPTLPLYPFSDAIDGGSNADPQSDQRAFSRVDGDKDGFVASDIGAFEYIPPSMWLPLLLK